MEATRCDVETVEAQLFATELQRVLVAERTVYIPECTCVTAEARSGRGTKTVGRPAQHPEVVGVRHRQRDARSEESECVQSASVNGNLCESRSFFNVFVLPLSL